MCCLTLSYHGNFKIWKVEYREHNIYKRSNADSSTDASNVTSVEAITQSNLPQQQSTTTHNRPTTTQQQSTTAQHRPTTAQEQTTTAQPKNTNTVLYLLFSQMVLHFFSD